MDEIREDLLAMRKRLHDLANQLQVEVNRTALMSGNLAHLVAIFTEHKTDSKQFMHESRATLGEINAQCTETNGRVNVHDSRFAAADREIRDIKETLAKVLWTFIGLVVSVIGAMVVFWATQR